MAGQRTLPGLGIRAFWNVGSNDYEQQLDPDLRKLSVLVQASVLSRTTNLPGSPSDGDLYIIPVGQTNENQIAARDNGAWVLFPPAEGFFVYVRDTDVYVKWSGSAWVEVNTDPGQTEVTVKAVGASRTLVLSDQNSYLRVDNAAEVSVTVPPNSDVAFPVGAVIQFRQAGVGKATLVAGAGVTINSGLSLSLNGQHASGALIKVAADEWDLTGDLEAPA